MIKLVLRKISCTGDFTGMIQVGTKNEIYLFRTGIHPELITKGGLKTVMENPKVLKIMHDATGRVCKNLKFQ